MQGNSAEGQCVMSIATGLNQQQESLWWDCSRPGTAARPSLRSGPTHSRRPKSLRDFVERGCGVMWTNTPTSAAPATICSLSFATHQYEIASLIDSTVGS